MTLLARNSGEAGFLQRFDVVSGGWIFHRHILNVFRIV